MPTLPSMTAPVGSDAVAYPREQPFTASRTKRVAETIPSDRSCVDDSAGNDPCQLGGADALALEPGREKPVGRSAAGWPELAARAFCLRRNDPPLAQPLTAGDPAVRPLLAILGLPTVSPSRIGRQHGPAAMARAAAMHRCGACQWRNTGGAEPVAGLPSFQREDRGSSNVTPGVCPPVAYAIRVHVLALRLL